MSTNYQFLGTDLDTLLEPYDGDHPNPDFINYEINGTSMVGRFAGSTRDWEKTFSGGGYYYNGNLINACYNGYKPSISTIVYTERGLAGAGDRDYTITRTDSLLKLVSSSTTVNIGPTSFRNNRVPMCIGLMFCGGGAGGSGNNDHSWGGGGGGMALCVLNFEGLTDTVVIRLGHGGGSSSNGGNSWLSIGGTVIVRAGGGAMKDWADGTSYGGAGGDAGRVINSHPNVHFISGVRGGSGVASYNTSNPWPGCPFNVKITERDSITSFGCRSGVSLSANDAYGGPSLNGSYISVESNGTNGAGGGAVDSKNGSNGIGGGGMLHIFY